MPRCPRTFSLLVVLAFGAALHAQETIAIPESASPQMVDNVLQGLRANPTRQKERYTFTLDGRQLTLARLENGTRLLVQSTRRARPGLETLNRYNERVAVTTRAVRYGKDSVVLEAGLDCRLGVTEASIRKFLTNFATDVQNFEQFLAQQAEAPQNPPSDPPVTPNQPLTPPRPPVVTDKPQSIPLRITPESDDKELEVTFPTQVGEEGETSWKIVWDIENGEQANKQGLKFPKSRNGSTILFKIKKAYFKPGPKAPWFQVLEDAHAQEFYVPYYFQNTRFFDLRDVGNYVRLNAREGGARSRLLGKQQMVMAELRDRGIAFKHGDLSRRSEELTLWANFQAGNYTYLVEFGFQDDGTIIFRHAPTGYNYFDHFDSGSHMHNCLWRIGVRLAPAGNGSAQNQVHVVKLPPDAKGQGPSGKLNIEPLERETALDWEPREFTKVRVTNPDVSVFPEETKKLRLPIGYDLVPQVQGQARHARNKDEGFTHHDFWVTRADTPERMYINLHKYFEKKEGLKPLDRADGVVLWHMSSALHVPRGEDGILAGNNLTNGQALANWTVVELRPRNLFATTPIYRKGK